MKSFITSGPDLRILLVELIMEESILAVWVRVGISKILNLEI